MRVTRIHQVGACATDFEATSRFYRDVLGAKFLAQFDPPGLLFFEFSGVRLLFKRDTSPAVIYFWVDDIDAAHRELVERGVVFAAEPHLIHRDAEGVFDNPGTEEWMAFFSDPGGNTLALATRR